MWPFSSTDSQNAAPPGVQELDDKLATLTRQVRGLELEWESTYDKLRSILARFNKRAERDQGQLAGEGGAKTVSMGTPGDPQFQARALALMRGRRR